MLTYWERKSRMPRGGLALAAEVHNCARSVVTDVMQGQKTDDRAMQRTLFAMMVEEDGTPTKKAMTLSDVFGPPPPRSMRRERAGLAKAGA